MTVQLTAALAVVAQALTGPVPAPQSPDFRPAAVVFVTPTDGTPEIKGRLIAFGPDTLTLLVDGRRVSLSTSRVDRIDLHGDPLKNGAVIGASVFTGLALLAVGREFSNHPGLIGRMVLGNAVFGALIGAGIDALHRGRTPLYGRTALTIAPSRKGLALAVTWKF